MSKDIKFIKDIDLYYKQFPAEYVKPLWDTRFIIDKIPDLKKDLDKIGITLYYSKWNEWVFNAGIFETQYFFEDFIPIDKTNYIYISEKRLYLDSTLKEGVAYIRHSISKDKIDVFNNIFISYFPNRTKGFINTKDSISIDIKPINTYNDSFPIYTVTKTNPVYTITKSKGRSKGKRKGRSKGKGRRGSRKRSKSRGRK